MLSRNIYLTLAALCGISTTFALDIAIGDLLTPEFRIKPDTWTEERIGVYEPVAITPDGDTFIVVTEDGSLWRYHTSNGQQGLITTNNLGFRYGVNVSTLSPDGRLFYTDDAAPKLMVTDVGTGTSSLFSNGDLRIAGGDIVFTDSGMIIGTSRSGGAVVMDTSGKTWGNPSRDLESDLKALTRYHDGRIIGVSSFDDSNDLDLVQIDTITAMITRITTIPDIGGPESFLRLASDAEGDFYVTVHNSNEDAHLYRIDGTTYGVRQYNLPEKVTIESTADLDLDINGKILLLVHDQRPVAPNVPGVHVVLRIDPETGFSEVAMGTQSALGDDVAYMAMDYQTDLFIIPKSTPLGYADQIFRQNLKTGGVTLVSSLMVPGAEISRARQIAVAGEDLFVIDEDTDQVSHLIHVDADSGEQSYVTEVGEALQVASMIYDPGTDALILSANNSGAGQVLMLTTENDAVAQVIGEGGYLQNVQGLAVDAMGDIFFIGSDNGNPGVFRLDSDTGVQSVISTSTLFEGPTDLTILPNGKLAVIDPVRGSIFQVDPATGNSSIELSDISNSLIDVVPGPYEPLPEPEPLFSEVSEALPSTGSWFELDWFGWFNETGNWILHLEHGWMNYAGVSSGSYFFYDTQLSNWLLVNPGLYPTIYAYPPMDDWLIYLEGSGPEQRWFYSYGSGDWITDLRR